MGSRHGRGHGFLCASFAGEAFKLDPEQMWAGYGEPHHRRGIGFMTHCSTTASTREPASLCEIKSMYDTLVARMDEVDELTLRPTFDQQHFSKLRWRLAMARRDRQTVLDNLYDTLVGRVGSKEAAALRQLRSASQKTSQIGSEHIARWSASEIAEDWASYCKTTRVIRQMWIDTIQAEQALLYPLLEK